MLFCKIGKTVLQNLVTIATTCQLTHRNTYQNVHHKILGKVTDYGSCIFLHCGENSRKPALGGGRGWTKWQQKCPCIKARPSKIKIILASPPDHWKSARLNYFFIFYFHRFSLKSFNTILRRQNLVEVWISCLKTYVFCVPMQYAWTWTLGYQDDNK